MMQSSETWNAHFYSPLVVILGCVCPINAAITAVVYKACIHYLLKITAHFPKRAINSRHAIMCVCVCVCV